MAAAAFLSKKRSESVALLIGASFGRSSYTTPPLASGCRRYRETSPDSP